MTQIHIHNLEATDSPETHTTEELSSHLTIKSIAIGYKHFCLLTANQEIWGYGFNANGQLGLNHRLKQVDVLTKVEHLPFHSNIVLIQCGLVSSGIVTDDNEVWIAGGPALKQVFTLMQCTSGESYGAVTILSLGFRHVFYVRSMCEYLFVFILVNEN
jgi:alpha-tubulin suppressor-like RCC1 family protein